jgi:group I intron endonuclease
MISSPSNNIYIGQTISFNRRMNSYKNYNKIKNQKALQNSFKKYGFENHKISILINCNKNQMDFWECFYIKLFMQKIFLLSQNGNNILSGK